MTTLSADIATKVSTEGSSLFAAISASLSNVAVAATEFVDTYYPALQSSRGKLSSFYIPSTTDTEGKTLPVLVFNGNVLSDPPAMRLMFEKEMPATTYEVQAFDCQVLNPNYSTAGPGPHPPDSGKNMSILISVSGWVRFGESKEAPIRGFSETFVLVPNLAAATAKAKGGVRNWLIQSQTFRLVT
ncbi:hypothetical protein FGG08_003887 [Glutinoglossum americanum]|uniref:NTF2 domain-containing protein n=1 Tax=Glutinoglossum americanum TaxID=1670608 RepID=A0A9P8L4E1_9PEZI|nr:hypothetical protein FGG08_003887 [Glutinoglossum americanum]